MTHPKHSKIYYLHCALVALCWGAAIGNIVYACASLPTMPRTVGYHFAADGTFDLFGDKSIAFWHPLIAEWLMLVIFTLLGIFAWRIKPLRKVSARASRALGAATAYWCDGLLLFDALLFGHWTYCVANQSPLHTAFAATLLDLLMAAFASLLLGIVAVIVWGRWRAKRTKA